MMAVNTPWERQDEPQARAANQLQFGQTVLGPQFRYDLRGVHSAELDVFIVENPVRDWSLVRWVDVGRPFRVENYSEGKRRFEEQNGDKMPVKTSWEMFNRSFHSWFSKDIPLEQARLRRELWNQFKNL